MLAAARVYRVDFTKVCGVGGCSGVGGWKVSACVCAGVFLSGLGGKEGKVMVYFPKAGAGPILVDALAASPQRQLHGRSRRCQAGSACLLPTLHRAHIWAPVCWAFASHV